MGPGAARGDYQGGVSMAKFKVGDKVRPIKYDQLRRLGYVESDGFVGPMSKATYNGVCIDGTDFRVKEVFPTVYRVGYHTLDGHSAYVHFPVWALEPAEPKLEVPKAPLFAPPESVNILGTAYHVETVEKFDDDADNLTGGFTDPDLRVIKLRDLTKIDEWSGESEEKVAAREKEIFRHEIVHAYLNESGLKFNSGVTGDAWARNEEMVDWIAIQGPKIMETWKEAGCLC